MTRGKGGRWVAVLTEDERFWRNVDQVTTPDGCWPWVGLATFDEDGNPLYGRHRRSDGTWVKAHAYAWDSLHGPRPPEDDSIDHRIGPDVDEPCTTTLCQRNIPDSQGRWHLEPCPSPENVRRRHDRDRRRAALNQETTS